MARNKVFALTIILILLLSIPSFAQTENEKVKQFAEGINRAKPHVPMQPSSAAESDFALSLGPLDKKGEINFLGNPKTEELQPIIIIIIRRGKRTKQEKVKLVINDSLGKEVFFSKEIGFAKNEMIKKVPWGGKNNVEKFVKAQAYNVHAKNEKGEKIPNTTKGFKVNYHEQDFEISQEELTKLYPIPKTIATGITKEKPTNSTIKIIAMNDLLVPGKKPIVPKISIEDLARKYGNIKIGTTFENALILLPFKAKKLLAEGQLSKDEIKILQFITTNPIDGVESKTKKRTESSLQKQFSKTVLDGLIEKKALTKTPLFLKITIDATKQEIDEKDFPLSATLKPQGLFSSLKQTIALEIGYGRNVKNMAAYEKLGERPVFLVSDADWKQVLPLVPVTTWTGNKNCNNGYNTPDNVCLHPTLVFHEEREKTELSLDGKQPAVWLRYLDPVSKNMTEQEISDLIESGSDSEKVGYSTIVRPADICSKVDKGLYFTQANIKEKLVKVGEKFHIDLVIKNCDKKQDWIINDLSVRMSSDFGSYVSDFRGKDFGVVPAGGQKSVQAVIEFKKPFKSAFDADSAIYFMQQYSTDNVIIIGSAPKELHKLLIAAAPLGAGVKKEQIKRIDATDFPRFWDSYEEIVFVKDDYELAVLASTYASRINAILVIQGTTQDKPETFLGKEVICVGSSSPKGVKCKEHYSLLELQKKYLEKTNTKNVVVVSPEDLEINSTSGSFWPKYRTDKSGNIISLYAKQSVPAPFLAAAKHELIIPVKTSDYVELYDLSTQKPISEKGMLYQKDPVSDERVSVQKMDNFITGKMKEFFEIPKHEPIVCNAGDPCSSGFDKKTTEVRFGENKLSFTIPATVKKQLIYALRFKAFPYCDEPKYVEVELFNEGKLIGKEDIYCAGKEKSISNAFFFGGSIYFNLRKTHLKSNKIELRFDGKLFFPEPEVLFEVEEMGRDRPLFTCSSADTKCVSGIQKTTVTGDTLSSNATTFKLSKVNTDSEYYLLVDILGGYETTNLSSPHSNFHIYVDGRKLKSKSVVGKDQYPEYIRINFPKDLIQETVTVRILPQTVKQTVIMRTTINPPTYSASVRLEPKVGKLPHYLTIIASPNAIPMTRGITPEDYCGAGHESKATRIEVDSRVYGSLNNYSVINFPVSRIMGISTSDISSNIARSLFFNKLPKNKDALLVLKWMSIPNTSRIVFGQATFYEKDEVEKFAESRFWKITLKNQLGKKYLYSGIKEVESKEKEIRDKYAEVFLNIYSGHGSEKGFEYINNRYLISNKIYLKPSVGLNIACSTCDYWGSGNLFCAQNIRRGAIIQQGSVDVSYHHSQFDDLLAYPILHDETIGEAMLKGKNDDFEKNNYNGCKTIRGDIFYIFLGDPTFKPKWWP